MIASYPIHSCPLTALLAMFPLVVCAVNPPQLPVEALYGAYEIIGRKSGDANGESYRGWVRIAVDGNEINIDRCVAGVHSEGLGHVISVTADEIPALRFHFGEQDSEATCLYQSDFDNLPRFSCHTYPADNARIAVPGLEAYFPIIWPVPLDFFNCY